MNSTDMVKQVVKQAKAKQNPAEIQRMVDFYSKDYPEVYLIHCLNCKRVIGVEVAPATNEPLITDRGRALFTYQGLCLSVRQRIDSTPFGEPMMGYECLCGNKTTLSALEQGIVPTQTVHVNKLSGKVADYGTPLPAQSPFEQADMIQNVKQNEATSKHKADYEIKANRERFETFMLERVK